MYNNYYNRNLKKVELQLKVTSDALEQVKLAYAKVKSQLDIAPKDDGSLFQKRKELQKEVDLAKKTLAEQVRKHITLWGAALLFFHGQLK